MADSVSFKVYLTSEGDKDVKDEIRRFGIDKDVVTNFDYLHEKLQTVFAGLRGRRFSVQWKDDDGDNVTISRDEDLQTALIETQNEKTRKLYVVVHSDHPAQAPEAAAAGNNRDAGVIHIGVECDGCNKDVQGYRYKCIQCPNYDLCGDCEAQGVHSEHCMIRISMPVHWRPHYGKRLAHHVNKFVKKAGSSQAKEEGQNECPYQNRRRHARPSGRCPEGPSWLDTLATYLNDWANLPGEMQCPMKQPSTSQQSEAGKSSEAGKTEEAKNADPHVEFLKNIGENIAQMLDPLGIDVDVQVKVDKKTGSAKESGAQTGEVSSSSKFPGQGKKLVESTDHSKKSTPTATPSISKAATPPPSGAATPNAERSSPENEEWTLLAKDGPSAPEPTSAPTTSGAIPKQVLPTAPVEPSTPAEPIYPELPKENVIHHPNPKIQRAVDAMVQMGFPNDGGWLTQLLVAKEGDIGKALDVLQPVRK